MCNFRTGNKKQKRYHFGAYLFIYFNSIQSGNAIDILKLELDMACQCMDILLFITVSCDWYDEEYRSSLSFSSMGDFPPLVWNLYHVVVFPVNGH